MNDSVWLSVWNTYFSVKPKMKFMTYRTQCYFIKSGNETLLRYIILTRRFVIFLHISYIWYYIWNTVLQNICFICNHLMSSILVIASVVLQILQVCGILNLFNSMVTKKTLLNESIQCYFQIIYQKQKLFLYWTSYSI